MAQQSLTHRIVTGGWKSFRNPKVPALAEPPSTLPRPAKDDQGANRQAEQPCPLETCPSTTFTLRKLSSFCESCLLSEPPQLFFSANAKTKNEQFSNSTASRGLSLPLRSPGPILSSKRPGVCRPLARPFALSLTRFNSTNSPSANALLTDDAATAAAATPPPPPPLLGSGGIEPSPGVYADLFNELSATDIAAAPAAVHIGYLKSLGLDYGWGPTALMEWVLEHIHVWAGTPWWLSIALTSVAVRVIMLRPALAAADTSGKLAAMRPLLEPLRERLQAARRNRDTGALLKLKAETSDIYRRAGIKVWRPFVPLLQIFPGYGIFRLIRGMAHLPVPGLDGGGVLWFRDLTVADPYYLLPTLNSLMLWRVTKVFI